MSPFLASRKGRCGSKWPRGLEGRAHWLFLTLMNLVPKGSVSLALGLTVMRKVPACAHNVGPWCGLCVVVLLSLPPSGLSPLHPPTMGDSGCRPPGRA